MLNLVDQEALNVWFHLCILLHVVCILCNNITAIIQGLLGGPCMYISLGYAIMCSCNCIDINLFVIIIVHSSHIVKCNSYYVAYFSILRYRQLGVNVLFHILCVYLFCMKFCIPLPLIISLPCNLVFILVCITPIFFYVSHFFQGTHLI